MKNIRVKKNDSNSTNLKPEQRLLNTESGFGLIEALVASVVGIAIVTIMSGSFARFYATEKDLNLRTELTEQLKIIRTRVDCATTTQGIDFSSIPTGGQPIELKSFPSGAKLVGVNGSTLGKFSFIANVNQDQTITLHAALLASETAEPRSKLDAPPSSFKIHPILKTPWDWAYSDGFISRTAPSLSSICGSSAAASSAGNVQVSCNYGSATTMTQQGCMVINPVNGFSCWVPWGFGLSPGRTAAEWSTYAQNTAPSGGPVALGAGGAGIAAEIKKCTKIVTGQPFIPGHDHYFVFP